MHVRMWNSIRHGQGAYVNSFSNLGGIINVQNIDVRWQVCELQ
jgi:hypothetical protein